MLNRSFKSCLHHEDRSTKACKRGHVIELFVNKNCKKLSFQRNFVSCIIVCIYLKMLIFSFHSSINNIMIESINRKSLVMHSIVNQHNLNQMDELMCTQMHTCSRNYHLCFQYQPLTTQNKIIGSMDKVGYFS